MSIYITNRKYISTNINLSKFEPLKPSRSGNISLLVFQNIQAAMFGPKNTMFILKILILPVYILT